DLSHRAAVALADVLTGRQPLEERAFAVDLNVEKCPRKRITRPLRLAADGPGQLGWRRISKQQVDVLQELAKQVIEQRILGAGMVVAVPPEPIAALGDVEFLPGALD